MSKLAFIAAASALLLGPLGCGRSADKSKPSAVNGGRFYAVKTDSASFYRYGPQQGNGPDLKLAHDTLVKLIRPSFGYSKVQLVSDGQTGYIASEDLHLAPANLLVAAASPPAPSATSSTPKFDLNSNDPRLISPPEQLPGPDLPPDNSSELPSASPPPQP